MRHTVSILSFTLLTILSLQSFSIEPVDPATMCDRFIGEQEKESCQKKASTYDLDWYAASICSQLEDDKFFFKCWEEIKGVTFNPKSIDKCDGNKETPDDVRLKCLLNQKTSRDKNKRDPASFEKNTFQTLKMKL